MASFIATLRNRVQAWARACLESTIIAKRRTHSYQRLEVNQLRLLTVLPPLTTRRDEPIRCLLEHASLEEITAEYAEWEKKTDHSLTSRPRTARLAWIQHSNSRRGHSLDDGNYLRYDETSARAHEAARYIWGDYITLSYCWGSDEKENRRQIILNGRFFQVTKNLEAALHAIRVSDGLTPVATRYTKIWADAICINQADDDEKKREIHRMKDIYGRSIGVFVHLGAEEEDISHGVDILRRTAMEVEHGIDRGVDIVQNRQTLTEADRGDYVALVKVLTRPYWSRLWVLQELAMSDSSTAMGCGHRTFRFEEVVLAAKFVWHNLESIIAMVQSPETVFRALNQSMWVILFIPQLRGLSQRLEDSRSITYTELQLPLFNLSQNAQSKLSHDKVFGLLAIMPKGIHAKMEQFTDYKLPIEAVFVAFSKAIIEYTGRLDIIYSKSHEQTMVPSWATDWRLLPQKASLLHDWHIYGYKEFNNAYQDLHQMIETARKAQADGGRSYPFEFSDTSDVLICSGVLIGRVDGMASDIPALGTAEHTLSEHIQPKYQHSPYGDDRATSRALVHTLFANPVWGDTDESSLLHIPWIAGESYSTDSSDLFTKNEELKHNVSQMAQVGWLFMFIYGYYNSFELLRCYLGQFRIGGKRFKDYFARGVSKCSIPQDRIQLDLAKFVGGHLGRRLITLTTGHFGLAPTTTQQGDTIYVILGCSLPVVLREVNGTSRFKVIGECYVEGFSDGEAVSGLDQGKYELHNLHLR